MNKRQYKKSQKKKESTISAIKFARKEKISSPGKLKNEFKSDYLSRSIIDLAVKSTTRRSRRSKSTNNILDKLIPPKRIKSRRVVRSSEEIEIDRLVTRIQTLGRRTNYRLKSIEKFTGKKESYLGKELISRLNVLNIATKSGNVAIGEKTLKKLSKLQLEASVNLLEKFLNSKTSTIKGIKEQQAKLQTSLSRTFKLTHDEITTLIRMFTNESLNEIYKYIDPSELWAIVDEVQNSEKPNKEYFMEVVRRYYNYTNNLDFKDALERFAIYFWGSTAEKEQRAYTDYEDNQNMDYFI